jgi:hypothetical protein
MLASKVIDLAKSTELRQLGVKDDVTAVLGFVNLGMLELYKRFPLKQEEAIITLQDGKTTYTLDGTDSDVAMTTSQNFLLVSECYDEQGDTVSINDESDPLGIMTPSYNTVEVPNVAQDEKLSVIYRVSPDFATAVSNNLALPPQLLEALLHYIGYRGNSTISSDTKAENNAHYIRFEQSCNRVIEHGLILPDDLESFTFETRGFT